MASELMNRLHLLGVARDRPNVVVATVHSFCLQHVIRPFRHIYDDRLPEVIRIAPRKVQLDCLAKAYGEVFKEVYDKQDRKFSKDFNTLRRQRVDIQFSDWKSKLDLAKVIQLYESYLLEQKFVDFDMITRSALTMIRERPIVQQSLAAKFPWIAVDEYQDLGYPLYRIVIELIEKTSINLFAIGDPDQSIFDFAGTDPKFLNALAKRPDVQPVIHLEKNYRSASELIEVSKTIIGAERAFFSDTTGGRCHIYECSRGTKQQNELTARIINEYMQNGVPPHRITILHRWRKGVDSIAEHLDSKKIPYIRDKHPLYDRSMATIQWLEDLAFWCLTGCLSYARTDESSRTNFQDLFVAWCSFQAPEQENLITYESYRTYFLQCLWKFRFSELGLHDWLTAIEEELSIESILERYAEIYPDDVDEYRKFKSLTEIGQPLSDMSLSKFAHQDRGVNLTTIHSSKGTEFDVVIVLGIEAIEENKNGQRLLYVGATRAERELHLVYTKITRPWTKSRYTVFPKYIKELRTKFRKSKIPAITFHDL